jgi:hypothetical protein
VCFDDLDTLGGLLGGEDLVDAVGYGLKTERAQACLYDPPPNAAEFVGQSLLAAEQRESQFVVGVIGADNDLRETHLSSAENDRR